MTRTCMTVIFAIVLSAICSAFAAAEPISAGSVAAGPSTPEMPEVRDARARFQKLDFAAARDLLKDAAKKNPDQPPADNVLANWLISTGRFGAVRARWSKR